MSYLEKNFLHRNLLIKTLLYILYLLHLATYPIKKEMDIHVSGMMWINISFR